MNLAVFWLIVLAVMVIIELATMGLTTVWFAGGALVAAILAAFHLSLPVQVVAFVVVSALLLCFTRPLAVKYFNKDRVKTNAEGLVGKQGIVTSEIDNMQGIGQVTVSGMEWTARTKDNSILQIGAVVDILAIEGVKLIVEERKEG